MDVEFIRALLVLLWTNFAVHGTECGVKKSSSRIVGGRDSGGYHYPWFALLVLKENDNFPVCAGSLITSRHVLTAAHCFIIKPSTPKEKLYNVLMGVYDRCNENESTRQKFGVIKVITHEEYNHETKFHDIAVMTLDRPADYTVVCLPTHAKVDVTEPAVLIGYGVTKQGSSKAPCHMMEANIVKYSKRDCRNTELPDEDKNEPTVVCAGRIDGGVDSCQGDSGGPLQTVTSSGKYVVSGIVSYGYGCAQPGLPGLYTDVASYLQWILSLVRTDEHERFYNRPRIIRKRVEFPNGGVAFPNGDGQNGYDQVLERNNFRRDNSSTVRFPVDDDSRQMTSDEERNRRVSSVLFPQDRK